ncbi:MAG: hypothetical protein HYX88_04210 [Chloroflexi bacterium]|nr:hypothetical protein [Chloroflexota bacterium]
MESWEEGLPPHVRERLAKIGEATQEERARMRSSGELNSLLSEYFNGDVSLDDFWKKLKVHQEEGRGFLVREAQARLIDTLRLQMTQFDFEERRKAILAMETIKGEGAYSTLELTLNSMESLRQEYIRLMGENREKIKSDVEKQLQTVARQAIGQGLRVDMGSSIEANINASPQWRNFITRHEQTYGERFAGYLTKLRELV